MTANSHPARSPEFLSRLHDGELSPAERAHFESHRAHCSECRTSASEFEAALTLYRSSHPAPAAPDLAARILRKLQASGAPRRRLFGTTFGIDLRWAGAAAAALLAAIVGSSIVATHEARERAARSPIPVLLKQAAGVSGGIPSAPASAPKPERMPSERGKDTFAIAPQDHERRRAQSSRTTTVDALKAPAENAKTVADDRVAPRPAQEAASSASAPASGEEGANEGKRERRAIVAAAPSSAASMKVSGAIRDEAQNQNQNQIQNQNQSQNQYQAQSPAQSQSQAQARVAEARPESPPAANTRRDTDRSGGEGGFAKEPQALPPLHLIVTSVDGNSSVPQLVATSASDLPVSLRGRQFFVLVDAAGRVREIRPRHAAPQSNLAEGDKKQSSEKEKEKDRQKEKEADSPVSVLRFQPGDAPRRLLIRIE